MSNIYGRQVVVLLTNKSGAGVIAGDVVILDSSNNTAFTTTTSAASTVYVGVAQETIASNATGRVLIQGYAALVNVNASVTRGHYGATHTVAKQAADAGAARVAGTFCWFLTGGTTPTAMVFPVDLAGAALTNPMTTGGDIIYGGASGTPTRLANGSSGQVLTSAGGTSAPTWGANPAALASASYYRTAGDYTFSSGTFADIDATNLKLTIVTGARRVLIVVTGTTNVTTGGLGAFDVSADGSRLGAAYGLVAYQPPGNNFWVNMSFSFLTDALTAASHEFRLMGRGDGSHTVTVNANTNNPLKFAVIEMA